jgi:hypothetical protein
MLPVRRQLAPPIVSGSAGFHADQAGWKFCEKRFQFRSPELLADDDLARSINAVDLKTCLARSRPIMVGCIVDDSPRVASATILAH